MRRCLQAPHSALPLPPRRPQGTVWKQLQVTPDVHNAVFAWVHYRQVGLQSLRLVCMLC